MNGVVLYSLQQSLRTWVPVLTFFCMMDSRCLLDRCLISTGLQRVSFTSSTPDPWTFSSPGSPKSSIVVLQIVKSKWYSHVIIHIKHIFILLVNITIFLYQPLKDELKSCEINRAEIWFHIQVSDLVTDDI